jgi:hypothetical protein
MVFAVLIDLTNWKWNFQFEHSSVSGDQPALVVCLALIISFFLVIWSYRLIRLCLDRGIRIPKSHRFVDWRPCVLLLPLMFHVAGNGASTTAKGVPYTWSYSYGSDLTGLSFCASVFLICLYQWYAGLKQASEDQVRKVVAATT